MGDLIVGGNGPRSELESNASLSSWSTRCCGPGLRCLQGTPETKHPAKGVQCYGEKASDFNARLVAGERVRLVRDGLFVNAGLARLGYAVPLAIAPDMRFADRFEELARQAREHNRGIWSACRGASISANLP